ncbi:MAG TPA: response regulator transcription factor [Chthonomonadales bacterium]|nr:response regulator transcription factor [Chthonomonadales bacterium]
MGRRRAVDLQAIRVELRCILRAGAADAGSPSSRERRLKRFRESFEEAIAGAGAALTHPVARGLLATFPDPIAAAHCVTGARTALADDEACGALDVSAALHIGTVGIAPDGTLVGADAGLADRLLQAAELGQTLVSEAYAAQVRPLLPEGMALADAGERTLAGLERPLRVYRLTAPGLRHTADARHEGEPAPERIRVMVADDEALFRGALARLLQLEPDIVLVGTAPNGQIAVELATAERPDVVLMDLDMPRLDGIEATRRIREAMPATQVVILTKFGDDENVFRALKVGAAGYVLKDADLDQLCESVRAAHRGEGYLSPALVTRVVREFASMARIGQQSRALLAELSKRELEVLELVGRGLRNREIAAKLYVAERTVKNHVSNILAKLQVNDRTAAAIVAQRHGLAR